MAWWPEDQWQRMWDGDDGPFGLLDPQAGDVRLPPEAWAERLASLRAGLSSRDR